MANKKVYWDAGHGGSDPGAVGYVKEADVTIKVVNYAHDYLSKNYTVTSKKDISADSLNTITKRANDWKADLFVSVHFNAGKGDGYEALVYNSSNKDLAMTFWKRVKEVGQNYHGTKESDVVKYRPDLAVLRDTNMKAILNEIAFVDNKTDIKDWDEDAELKVMGEALAKACVDFLGLKKKTSSSTTTKSTSYQVKVTSPALNVRKGPGTKYDVETVIRDKGVYTITEVSGDWGKLKSGVGWINLNYTKKM